MRSSPLVATQILFVQLLPPCSHVEVDTSTMEVGCISANASLRCRSSSVMDADWWAYIDCLQLVPDQPRQHEWQVVMEAWVLGAARGRQFSRMSTYGTRRWQPEYLGRKRMWITSGPGLGRSSCPRKEAWECADPHVLVCLHDKRTETFLVKIRSRVKTSCRFFPKIAWL
jgi:hypothetical protein